MKKLVSILSITSILLSSTAFAGDCHVGFKIKNAVFTQELKNSTVKELGLKDFDKDQFNLDKLSFTANRVYGRDGRYQKCDLEKVRYADERFSGLGTALKKGLVGAGLFTAGIATFYLTFLSLYYSQSPNSSVQNKSLEGEDKSLDNNKSVIIVTTYDHLDPYYYEPIVYRRTCRTTNVYYHYNYMSAYDYERLRMAELGAIAATMLIVEAFEVPRNMRQTNLQGPAEKNISEEDCTVDAIKKKLVFDQYLYCGNFEKNASNKFSQKETEVRKVVRDFTVDLKKGKFDQARKNMTIAGKLNSGSNDKLANARDRIIMGQSEGIHDIKALDGRSPHDKKQKLEVFVGEQKLEVVCDQDWTYEKNDLYAVGADFIPLNSYSNCAVEKI